MKVWLITVGEPLPTDGEGVRLLRTGLFAQLLAARGHEVVWWSSTFDHDTKRQRFQRHTSLHSAPGLTLRLLHARPYRRNVSLARIVNHVQLGRAFTRACATAERPDVIVCSFPTIELSLAAGRFGAAHGVPVVLDVRDLWPDVFLDLVPRPARPVLRLALWPWFRAARAAFAGARAVIGVTAGYVKFGLAKARRAGGPDDLDFPLGYVRTDLPQAAVQAAQARWSELLGAPHPDQFTCCFFGTMGVHVELGAVIEAARQLQGGPRKINFVLCGAGDHLASYRAMAAGCGNVIFPGWITHAEIWALMRRSAVGLAPYADTDNFRSGLPNKPIEYFSAGLPVLSSVNGVLGELLRTHQCGVVYRSGDAAHLAAKLAELYDDSALRRRMGANALALFEQRFTAERVYSQMADYLERVARDRR